MIEAPDLGLAFQPVCKCGSTSMLNLIYRNSSYFNDPEGEKWEWWMRREVIKRYRIPIGKKIDKNLFLFCFVRNPWTRFVSAFLQFSRWFKEPVTERIRNMRDHANKMRNGKLFLKNEQIIKLIDGDTSFNSFANFVFNIERNEAKLVNYHWKPQYDAIRPHIYKYDFIGAMENYKENIAVLEKHTKIVSEDVHLNKSKKYNYRDYFKDFKYIDEFERYYEKDLEFLEGYNFYNGDKC